jgi:arylformamidase
MKIIDLTLPYSEKIAGFSSETARTIERDGWNARTLHIYSHAGTHMDAPLHFGVSDETIDQIPPQRFFSNRAWVVNLTPTAPKHLITIGDLGTVKDQFQHGDSLLLRTDWSKQVGTAGYRNDLPRISEDLAHWCVENRVNILGVEPPSVADVNNLAEVTAIHHILLRGGILIVEGLTNLDVITKPMVQIIALPLKIEGGDGAPCRVVAIENQ